MSAHIAVLTNPSAGKGRAAHASEVAIERLRAAGADVRAYAGASAEETARLAALAVDEAPTALVVIGGDGTLSGILAVATAAAVPIVFVAAGTGNDFSRALDLPRDDAGEAAMLALNGRPRVVDVGEVRSGGTTRLFLTIAALGFDAKVTDRTDRLRWPRGRMRYYLALLIELVRLSPMAFRLSIDGEPERDAPGTLIAVGNTASYGGGMPICVGAEPDDGMLDIVLVRTLGRLRLLSVFPKLLRGSHLTLPEVTHRRAGSVHVSAPDLVVYADGERIATGECTIAVRAAALTVMVPVPRDRTGATLSA